MPFCGSCGKEIPATAAFCPNCGRPTQAQPPPSSVVYRQLPQKDPGIAALLAIIGGLFGLPGIGHIYVGRIGRGLLILFSGLILFVIWIFVFLLSLLAGGAGLIGALVLGILFIVGYIIIWFWQIFDAHNLAKRYNEIVAATGREPW